MPSGCERALDVGCGDGRLTRRTAARCNGTVIGLDVNEPILEVARERAAAVGDDAAGRSLQFVLGEFLEFADPVGFDFVTASASLHHMPFREALLHSAELLRPGGVLAVLGVYRSDGLRDLAVAAVAGPVNALYAVRRRTDRQAAPVLDPRSSLAEVRAVATTNLPGVRIRQLLFWRYLLVWEKPRG